MNNIPRYKLIVTDIDDTLYSWINFFLPAFRKMLDEINKITKIDKDKLIEEFHSAHQYKRCAEEPYTAIDLPSIRAFYSGLSSEKIIEELSSAWKAFDDERDKRLCLFTGVDSLLKELKQKGVKLICYTDAAPEGSANRLNKLGILDLFDEIFAAESKSKYSRKFFENVSVGQYRKPDPDFLKKICEKYGVAPEDTLYMGDSLSKDISMAVQAGIDSAFVDVAKVEDGDLNLLMEISCRTEAENKADLIHKHERKADPTYVITDFAKSREVFFK